MQHWPAQIGKSVSTKPSLSGQYGRRILCRMGKYREVTPSTDVASCPIFKPMQVIQYIDMIKTDLIAGLGTITTSEGGWFYDISTGGFQGDDVEGHGTHTAGSALGATLNVPAETTTCSGTKDPGCVGGCIDADRTSWGDDLLALPIENATFSADIDRICPMHGCDDETVQWCLSDDVEQTLTEHGGMAQGAKLAFFDVFANDEIDLMDYVGNGLWEPCLEAGCKLHSNSWGGPGVCLLTAQDILYDDFMYKVGCSTVAAH